MINLIILIPTFNEVKNIVKLIPLLKAQANKNKNIIFNVFVIDDSSPDGTGLAVEKLKKKYKNNSFFLSVINRPHKEGIGKAYLHAFSIVNKLNFNDEDYLIMMDADLSHNPSYISTLISEANKGAKFVVGSRYYKTGGVIGWKWYRKLLSILGNFYARIILGKRSTDYTSGLNMINLKTLRNINLKIFDVPGYGFFINFKYQISKIIPIIEIPIVLKDRVNGKSKMPPSTIISSFILVLSIKWMFFNRLYNFYFRKRKNKFST